MAENYVIHGGSLAAAILASKLLLRGDQVRLSLPEGEPLVRSWKAIQLGTHSVNNGFHAIDVARAPGLVHLLGIELGLDLVTDLRPSGVLIGSQLMNALSGPAEWQRLGNFPTESKVLSFEEIDVEVDIGFLSFLESLGEKYADDWHDSRSQMIPWFLPKSILLRSNEEGDQYRNLVRLGLAQQQRVAPAQGPFQALGKQWLDTLVALGIEVISSKVSSKKSPSNPPDREFHLSLFETETSGFSHFSEVLVASEHTPQIGRISSVRDVDDSGDLLLVESFHDPGGRPDEVGWGNFLSSVTQSAVTFIDTAQTRLIPRKTHYHRREDYIVTSGARSSTEVAFSPHGPINMAKVFDIAQRAFEEVANESR